MCDRCQAAAYIRYANTRGWIVKPDIYLDSFKPCTCGDKHETTNTATRTDSLSEQQPALLSAL